MKKFNPRCMTTDTQMAINNRNQLMPCCFIDTPFLVEDPTIKKLLSVSNISEHKSIKEIYKYIFKSDGKKIRARLNLISSSINRKKKNRIKLAAIIELLHTATLVHDDVVDDSSFRRGNESVNNIWSNAHGVLIGDYIYSKAFIYMVDVGKKEILKELASATNDISQGELIPVSYTHLRAHET